MYKLRSFDDERWVVVDSSDREVQVGTLHECEDRLDRQENVDRRSIPREPGTQGWLARLWGLLTGAARRPHPVRPATRVADPPPSTRSGE